MEEDGFTVVQMYLQSGRIWRGGRGEANLRNISNKNSSLKQECYAAKKEIINFMTRSNELEEMYSIQKNTFKY